MAFKDLREWIDTLERENELARIKAKVDWDSEIGGIVQKNFDTKGPALLFENIKDHENTFSRRLFTASLSGYSRIALMMGLPKDTHPNELVSEYMKRVQNPIKPVMVKTGAVKENIKKGGDVDITGFPAPKWHDKDGGRFIGTCDGVVTKDPETGWINVGLYRRQVHDRNHTGILVAHGSHIWRHWRKYKKLGKKTMPMAVINGWDPVLPMTACSFQPPGVDEYDIMGALRQQPVELVMCETLDIPVPANCEFVLEGEISMDYDTFKYEGPFGEYTGYYSRGGSDVPVFTINCMTHRNDPILQGTMEGVPINEDHYMESINHSGIIWNEMNKQMVGISGVNVHPSTGWANIFVQITQPYAGQVFQAASLIWGIDSSSYVGKNVIVVDDDIDIFDLDKVMWAIAYRVDPPRDIHMFPGWLGAADVAVHPKDRIGRVHFLGTHLLIDATKWLGYPKHEEWMGERFAPVCLPDEKTVELVNKRWKEYGIK